MSKEEAKTEKTLETKESASDNLLNDLASFNQGSVESEEAVEANEEVKEETAVEQEESEKWIIENKFADTEEGREKLANAYKELQSKSDKDRNQFQSKMKEYEQFEQLDEILTNNPSVVEAMQNELKRLANKGDSPEKPEDYDILDETVEGTSSYKWRQDYDKHLVEMGKSAAKAEVDNLRAEMQQKEATQKRVAKLTSMGLSGDEIKEYYSFMTEKEKPNR